MNGLAIVALVVVGLWLGVLTLMTLLLVRQIGLLTVTIRLSPIGNRVDANADGPKVGSRIPEAALSALPQLRQGSAYLLRVSASCEPCQDLIAGLRGQHVTTPVTVLVTGRGELANGFAALLPSGMDVVSDPEATTLAEVLQIQSAPFAVAINGGTVIGKRYVRSAIDFMTMVEGKKVADTHPRLQMEVHHVNWDAASRRS